MLTIDKEFKNCIPPLSDEEFKGLESDILENGIRTPIDVWNDVIVDGHNRYQIAQNHNIPFTTNELHFESKTHAKIWMIRNQLNRRNLNDANKIELALMLKSELLQINEQERIKNRELNTHVSNNDTRQSQSGKTRQTIADNLGISTGKLAQAEYVKKHNPDIWNKAKNDELTVGGAYKKVKKQQKFESDKKALAYTVDIPDNNNVWHGDFRKLGNDIPDNSVDMIFTDPPYGAEYLELFEDLSKLANRILKPSGLLVTYSGQFYLPSVLENLGKYLEYIWCFGIRHTGSKSLIQHRNVINHWKPILCYCKSPIKILWNTTPDMIDGKMEKSNHEWQQGLSEAIHYISNLCVNNNATILDPMCGSGTSLLAAKKLNHKYIGIEKEEIYVLETRKRLSDD